MDDLVVFLRERLHEDEHVAGLVANGPGEAPMRGLNPLRIEVEGAVRHAYVSADPARVLAEVDAKRRIVDGIADADVEAGYITGTFTAWDVLRLLALPYADHADYRQEWRT